MTIYKGNYGLSQQIMKRLKEEREAIRKGKEPQHDSTNPIRDVEIKIQDVFSSYHILDRIPELYDYASEDSISAESVNIPFKELYDLNGRRLFLPVEIPSGNMVIGKFPFRHYRSNLQKNEFICIETRSRFARVFQVSAGFYTKNKWEMHKRFMPYLDVDNIPEDGIYVYIMNHAEIPFVIDEDPCFISQITISPDTPYHASETGKLKLISEGEDVTHKMKVIGSSVEGYVLTLSPEIWFMRTSNGKKIFYSQIETEKIITNSDMFEKCDIRDIHPKRLSCPNLTQSNEEIIAGCPAYVFPVHYEHVDGFCMDRTYSDSLKELFLFKDGQLITGNSGLIHAGSRNRTVFENIFGYGCDPKSLFSVDEPYGYVIPLGLVTDKKDVPKYKGKFRTQPGICL